ncbi:hypothetical protein EPB69_07530 [Geobacillus stearothermophilus]|nr:hypothetical protein EPB69_07530 [Geobacillus stearothermophilus]
MPNKRLSRRLQRLAMSSFHTLPFLFFFYQPIILYFSCKKGVDNPSNTLFHLTIVTVLLQNRRTACPIVANRKAGAASPSFDDHLIVYQRQALFVHLFRFLHKVRFVPHCRNAVAEMDRIADKRVVFAIPKLHAARRSHG